jgi:hypothetical protein
MGIEHEKRKAQVIRGDLISGRQQLSSRRGSLGRTRQPCRHLKEGLEKALVREETCKRNCTQPRRGTERREVKVRRGRGGLSLAEDGQWTDLRAEGEAG